ncbi:hypothetical protein SMD20_09065 [Nonomuraea sp. LP-02]|uniref:hypothetical protein n=1 Tax=Nonomuraea sp. LP-02 TaxID=3097960 RepID=UPI002E30BFFA|nr:hypothetical protein [Nonomuraea sp. LP-02]MED7924380.1 hypothetical protein [Nonomuraea sp. LP-02]
MEIHSPSTSRVFQPMTKWGSRVSIKAPAARTVTTKLDPDKPALQLPPAPER